MKRTTLAPQPKSPLCPVCRVSPAGFKKGGPCGPCFGSLSVGLPVRKAA